VTTITRAAKFFERIMAPFLSHGIRYDVSISGSADDGVAIVVDIDLDVCRKIVVLLTRKNPPRDVGTPLERFLILASCKSFRAPFLPPGERCSLWPPDIQSSSSDHGKNNHVVLKLSSAVESFTEWIGR